MNNVISWCSFFSHSGNVFTYELSTSEGDGCVDIFKNEILFLKSVNISSFDF